MTTERTTAGVNPDKTSDMRARMIEAIAKHQTLSDELRRAFLTVPRHAFLPGVPLETVYSGSVIPTRFNEKHEAISSSSEVAVMTSMIEVLRLEAGQRILEIGAGTGYNAAILAELVGGRGRVTTLEIDDEIVDEARDRLDRAGYGRVEVRCADGWDGWREGAPFDRIELTASVADLSPKWNDQLVDGGILVVPFQFRPHAFAVLVLRKDGERFVSTAVLPGGFMPLRGVGAPVDARRIVGGWRVVASRPIDEERLASLLAMTPTVEVGEPLSWMAFSMLAAVDPDIVSIMRTDRPAASLALLDEQASGLAAVEWSGGNLAGPRTLLVAFGAPEVRARLRARLAEMRGRSWDDLSVTAVPAGSAGPGPDEFVFERENYSFVMSTKR